MISWLGNFYIEQRSFLMSRKEELHAQVQALKQA